MYDWKYKKFALKTEFVNFKSVDETSKRLYYCFDKA